MLDTYDFAGTAGIMLFIFMLVQVVDDLVAHSAVIVSGALHEMLPQARGGGKVPVTWPAQVVSGRGLLVLPESSLVWKISVATLTVGHGGTIKRPGLCKNALSAFICQRSSKGSGKGDKTKTGYRMISKLPPPRDACKECAIDFLALPTLISLGETSSH